MVSDADDLDHSCRFHAGEAVGPTPSRLFLVASGAFLGGYDDSTLVSLLHVAKKHGITNILVEPNFGGGMFTKLLQSQAQKHYQCGIQDTEWSSVSKEQRIVDTLEPVLNQHC